MPQPKRLRTQIQRKLFSRSRATLPLLAYEYNHFKTCHSKMVNSQQQTVYISVRCLGLSNAVACVGVATFSPIWEAMAFLEYGPRWIYSVAWLLSSCGQSVSPFNASFWIPTPRFIQCPWPTCQPINVYQSTMPMAALLKCFPSIDLTWIISITLYQRATIHTMKIHNLLGYVQKSCSAWDLPRFSTTNLDFRHKLACFAWLNEWKYAQVSVVILHFEACQGSRNKFQYM